MAFGIFRPESFISGFPDHAVGSEHPQGLIDFIAIGTDHTALDGAHMVREIE